LTGNQKEAWKKIIESRKKKQDRLNEIRKQNIYHKSDEKCVRCGKFLKVRWNGDYLKCDCMIRPSVKGSRKTDILEWSAFDSLR
jgi:hypothetical protein